MLTHEQETRLLETIERTIEKKVNGKIDSFRIEMRDTLTEQNIALQPALDAIANWNTGSKAIKWLFGVLMAIGAFYLMFTNVFKK